MNETQERDWAQTHFRDYLLHRLSDEETLRVARAVAIHPGLIEELEAREDDLIEAYLDGFLSGEEREGFERRYVHTTDADHLARLRFHEALREPQISEELKSRRGEPLPMDRAWRLALVAACLVALALGALYAHQSQELARVIAALKLRDKTGEPPRDRNKRSENQEIPAGFENDGLVLPGDIGNAAAIRVSEQPARLVFRPVPDYRSQYRIRVDAAGREERNSGPLDPVNFAVDYAPPGAAKLPLPWEVWVIEQNPDGGRVVGRFTLSKP